MRLAEAEPRTATRALVYIDGRDRWLDVTDTGKRLPWVDMAGELALVHVQGELRARWVAVERLEADAYRRIAVRAPRADQRTGRARSDAYRARHAAHAREVRQRGRSSDVAVQRETA